MNAMNTAQMLKLGLQQRNAQDLSVGSNIAELITQEIITAVTNIKGDRAGEFLKQHGIQNLHKVIDASDFTPLREQVLENLRWPMLEMAVAVGREFLGWTNDFYVDDYLVLRINFPYEVARQSKVSSENPGTGRLSPAVREIFFKRKVIDPDYNPGAFNANNPQAAWLHGPHRDSWVGHSLGGRNIWMAVADVPAEAGMVLYPEIDGDELTCDPRSLYLQAGSSLPKPTYCPLKAGEMLVFDPEILHGTHLNTTDITRIAITLRLNVSKPAFNPQIFYAREFWRMASDIEAGKDEVIFLPREENFGAPPAEHKGHAGNRLPCLAGEIHADTQILTAALDEKSKNARRVILESDEIRVMVIRGDDGLKAYKSACPHNGADLAYGGCDDSRLYCPSCGVGFDFSTGHTNCASLTLQSYKVWETSEGIHVQLEP